MPNPCMPDVYPYSHSSFIAENFKAREERLREITEFWRATKRMVFSLLLAASFLIFYLLLKLNEALSMLN